ncbi:LysM peptidoglycan-binding domain-containing protein [Xanthomonas oryzae pv. oryzae]|uniref:LysM peptidoglycan-binding domain-containing protein n=1 Tax=Xanthomonas oryzae TaxID=347 RepID=UPI003D34B0C6
MTYDTYIVKSGDSLSKIARLHGTEARTIAELNGINNPDVIRVGQKIRIPIADDPKANLQYSKDDASPASITAPSNQSHNNSHEEKKSSDSEVFFQFFDVLSLPIEGLKVIIEAGGNLFTSVTGNDGSIPSVEVPSKLPRVSVKVEKATGGTKEVANFNAEPGSQHVLLTREPLNNAPQMRDTICSE